MPGFTDKGVEATPIPLEKRIVLFNDEPYVRKFGDVADQRGQTSISGIKFIAIALASVIDGRGDAGAAQRRRDRPLPWIAFFLHVHSPLAFEYETAHQPTQVIEVSRYVHRRDEQIPTMFGFVDEYMAAHATWTSAPAIWPSTPRASPIVTTSTVSPPPLRDADPRLGSEIVWGPGCLNLG